jgi:radical SAM superfamily enzyme YgiQ (UPF0313 family)
MPLKIILSTPQLDKIIEPIYDKPIFVRPSLAHIAGYVRDNSNYEIKCIDAKFSQLKLNQLVKKIIDFKPDIIGISSYTYEINEVKKLARELKKEISNINIVLGGSHITAIPEETMKEIPEIDIGIIGEGEHTLLKICDSIFLKKDYSDISNIVYRDKNKLVLQKKKNYFLDLNKTRIPAWDLLPRAKEYYIQTTRGCPFNCNFCFNPNGNKIRYRNTNDVIDEIKFLIEKFSPDRISIGDEAFAANKEFAHKLIDEMIKIKIWEKVTWDIQTHISFLDDNLLKKMKEAKISKIEVGVESGNEEILKKTGKCINKKMVENAFLKLRKYKIKTGAFFILGHPNETRETILDTIRFAAKINPNEPIFAIMVPFPGTVTSNYVKDRKAGYLSASKNWSDFRKQINQSIVFRDFSKIELKFYFLFANLFVFLYNFRFFDLIKKGYRYRKSIVNYIRYG